MRCAFLKLTALALIGAATNTYAHELRGATAVSDVVATDDQKSPKLSPIDEMDGEDEDEDWTSRSRGYDYGRGAGRRSTRRYTDRGQRRYRRSNSTPNGWKRSAAGKREDRRAARRAGRRSGRRTARRVCNRRNCLEDLGLHPDDVDLLADFFKKYEDEDVDFIADFLFDELEFDDYDEDYDFDE